MVSSTETLISVPRIYSCNYLITKGKKVYQIVLFRMLIKSEEL